MKPPSDPAKVLALFNKNPADCTGYELTCLRRICGYSLDHAAALLKVTPYVLNDWERNAACRPTSKPDSLQCQLIKSVYRLGEENQIPLDVESRKPTPYGLRCNNGCNQRQLIFLTAIAFEYELRKDTQDWKCPRCGGEAEFDEKHHDIYRSIEI